MRAGIGGGWGSRITPRTGEFGFGKLAAPFSSAPPRSRLLLQSCQVRGTESRAGPSPPPLLRAVDERRDRIMVPKGGGDRPWTAVLSEGLPPRCSVSTCLCVHSSTNWSHRGAIGGGAEGVSFATASRAGRWKGESRRLLLGPFHRHPALEVVGVNLTTRLPVPGNEDGRPWWGTNWTPPANELSLCWLYTTQSSKQIIPSDGDDDAQGGMMDLHLLLHSTYSSSSRTHTHTHTTHAGPSCTPQVRTDEAIHTFSILPLSLPPASA